MQYWVFKRTVSITMFNRPAQGDLTTIQRNLMSQITQLTDPYGPTFTQKALRFALSKYEFRVTRNFQNFIVLFFIKIRSCKYILICLCNYVPCSTFYSFPVLVCTYSMYIYKISKIQLVVYHQCGVLIG